MRKFLLVVIIPVILTSFSVQSLASSRPSDQDLISAVEKGDLAMVQQLLDRHANIEARGEYGRTALMRACYYGKTDIARLLLERGASVSAIDELKSTPLHYAVDHSNLEMAKILIERGADVKALNRFGRSPLHSASPHGKAEVAALLIEHGADVNLHDTWTSATPLHEAAEYGNPEVALLLMQKGADVNALDGLKRTPLINASGIEVVKVLLAHGANVDASDYTGKTALATHYGNSAIVQMLQHPGAKSPLDDYLIALQNKPSDEAVREKIIALAREMNPAPTVPDHARAAFIQAATLIKLARRPADYSEPIGLLNKALVLAPWWGDAYYNLSRALELSGRYDDAVKQLNYYLETKPSETDAAEARGHLAVIQVEKESAAREKQENDDQLKVKYVSGGTTRLRYEDAPKWWYPGIRNGVGELYVYDVLAREDPFFVNTFRFPNGHFLSISLIAQSNNGMYAGDKIGVYDITDNSCIWGNDFGFGASDYMTPCGGRYYVKVSDQPNATVTVTYPATGASVTLPVALLYRGRALKGRGIFGGCSGTVQQGGARAMVLEFDCNLVKAAEDPTVNAAALTPTTVKPK